MNPLTPLELLDIIEREHGFESPSIRLALERAKKEHELLALYRLEKEAKEKYHTSGSLYIMQHVLDEIRDVAEEIQQIEEELK